MNESFPGTWGAVCEFHWPGDDRRGALASTVTYSFRIEPAHSSAIRLVDSLDNEKPLTPNLSLYIVAHSLGCRVTLEALREIANRKKKDQYNGPVVRKVVLMARGCPLWRTACRARATSSRPKTSRSTSFTRARTWSCTTPSGPGRASSASAAARSA